LSTFEKFSTNNFSKVDINGSILIKVRPREEPRRREREKGSGATNPPLIACRASI